MRRRVCLVALTTLLPAALLAQQLFHSGVDVVRVDALVTDGRRAIAGLDAREFELRDNGVVQTIDAASFESLPLSVILALDTSGSVAGDRMRHLRSAVDVILRGLQGADRAALITFSHRIWLRTGLMADLPALRAMMGGVEAEGGTALRDAVYAALATSDVQDSRALVVVFSDGLDNMSWMDADVVERAARRANAVVYGVAIAARTVYRAAGVGNRVILTPHAEYVRGQTEFLDRIADATGGRVLKADATEGLPQAFEAVLREFRTRYVITYSPQGVGGAGWHRIELRVKGRKATVTARAGYQR